MIGSTTHVLGSTSLPSSTVIFICYSNVSRTERIAHSSDSVLKCATIISD